MSDPELDAFDILKVLGVLGSVAGILMISAYIKLARADTLNFLKKYMSALKHETTDKEKEGIDVFDQLGNIGDLVRLYWDKNKQVYRDNTGKVREVTSVGSVGNPLLFNLDYGWGEYGRYLPQIIQRIKKRGEQLGAGAYSRSDEIGYAHRNTVFSVGYHRFIAHK